MTKNLKARHIDNEEQFLVKIAWACEIEGITQAAAAERFGVTRLRINKSLAEARARGIIRVSINSPFGSCVALEEKMKARFGLQDAHIIPTPKGKDLVQIVVGAALGHYLADLLKKPKIKSFGISWGYTLNIATRYIPQMNRPKLEILSVMGGVPQGSDLNSYEITQRLSNLCNAKASYFTAPMLVSSKESREILMQQDIFVNIIKKIKSSDAIALTVGSFQNSLFVNDSLPPQFKFDDLKAAGGVGDLLGYILDKDGEMIDHPINGLQMGLSLQDLKDIPNVILAAGRLHKKEIMNAVLKKGYIDTLVTDEETAKAILSLNF